MEKLLESIALEVESCSRDIRAALTRIHPSEKTASICALVMFAGCFLPWFSLTHSRPQTGLDGFAALHFGIAISLFMFIRRIAHQRRIDYGSLPTGHGSEGISHGRIALCFLLFGAMSTATCIALLIHFTNIASYSNDSLDVRYGFYIVLLSGMGISGCGIVKFS